MACSPGRAGIKAIVMNMWPAGRKVAQPLGQDASLADQRLRM